MTGSGCSAFGSSCRVNTCPNQCKSISEVGGNPSISSPERFNGKPFKIPIDGAVPQGEGKSVTHCLNSFQPS